MIEPLARPIIEQGKLFYCESSRAHSIVRFKKTILEHFPQLRSRKKWQYSLEYWRDVHTTIRRITEAQERKEGIPLLLFIREGETNERPA